MATISKRTYQLLKAAQRGEIEFEEDRILLVTSASNWKIVTEPVEKLIVDGLLARQGIKARLTDAGRQALSDYTGTI